ncbi:MAG: DUF4954 family protein [Bacteroidetes bacterium]|nr:DUF4954 family protein [Bacteroidota bacterium]
MNEIRKSPLKDLGYNFIPLSYLPKGKDEYHLRFKQQCIKKNYRQLTDREKEILLQRDNQSDNWSNILVTDGFNAEQVRNCFFYGHIRIGKMDPICLEFHKVKLPVGLYNSTIVSCDIGDNAAIHHVGHLGHYIIGDEVIISRVDEMTTAHSAKFGNGIVKEGEDEKQRVWLEVCNENAGRKIIPFIGMLPGDAWLWSHHRDHEKLQSKLKAITENLFDKQHGYYGIVGDRTIIKSCKIIKDVNIGSDAYLKGANKLKNLTIHSAPYATTQIGEGCELVNGIIEEKCRIFYGVKAVRFYLASNSQLKYGARLINSYLGNNSTISCCEVLNSLIYPFHEQHHNNSFLCAANIGGQSNIAAGATLGSNHNSRSADGELIAGRGFWPALCVSIKHHSKFASFTLLAKGDYPTELNIRIPFALVSNDVSRDRLVIMPGYWFMYNMYALARNAGKYVQRDGRPTQKQRIENHYLAPDSINEIFDAFEIIEYAVGKAYLLKQNKFKEDEHKTIIKTGKKLLNENNPVVDQLEVLLDGVENSGRKVLLIKARAGYHTFREMIEVYCAEEILSAIEKASPKNLSLWIKENIKSGKRKSWINVGGQLIEQSVIDKIIADIAVGKIKSWEQIHRFYLIEGERYPKAKLAHAIASYNEVFGNDLKQPDQMIGLLEKAFNTKTKMLNNMSSSREKDYTSPFRTMAYANRKEMDAVTGKLEENSFILEQTAILKKMKAQIGKIKKK